MLSFQLLLFFFEENEAVRAWMDFCLPYVDDWDMLVCGWFMLLFNRQLRAAALGKRAAGPLFSSSNKVSTRTRITTTTTGTALQ